MEITKKQFDILAQSVRSYLGMREQDVSPLADTLRPLLETHGWQLLHDAPALERELAERGVEPAEAARLHLLAMTPGFDELLQGDERTEQADLARVVRNAVETTGLSRETALRLVGDVAWAAGIAVPVHSPQGFAQSVAGRTYVVPAHLYREILQEFEKNLVRQRSDASAELDISPLEPLVAMGIPQAQYYVGFCLLHGIGSGEDSEKGLELLHAAADAGVAAAAAALGDHYYRAGGASNWSRAYALYTGFGAPALSGQRRLALASIVNQKIFNRKVLAACAVLFALFAATVFLAPATALYGAYTAWGCICLLLQAALLGAALLRYRTKPYDFFYPVPTAMFGLWGLYMAVRLLF